jgi:uncharacterized protein involved in cysteine biosynthesis
MKIVPCPLCGYDALRTGSGVPAGAAQAAILPAGAAICPHCALQPREPSLRAPRARLRDGLLVGLYAVPQGLYYLASTSGVKRWLIPPLALTALAFAALFWWLWGVVQGWMAMLRESGGREIELDPAWVERAVRWLLGLKAFVWLAEASTLLVFLLVSSVAAFWAFSILYEAVSGPFLDEIHGRIEERWFGVDPRKALHRPTSLPTRDCALWSAGAGVAAVVTIVGLWKLVPWPFWLALLAGLPLPFVLASLIQRQYGRWLVWVVRLEGGTLWVSVKAALVAGVILVLFFPLKFVPGIGYVLFGGVAGFTTAISLLDIPFERRQWSLSQRLAFLLRHAPAVVLYGVTSSLLFVLPLLGPILMVPAASVGGLWMITRLDKDFLRPAEQRVGARAPAPASE